MLYIYERVDKQGLLCKKSLLIPESINFHRSCHSKFIPFSEKFGVSIRTEVFSSSMTVTLAKGVISFSKKSSILKTRYGELEIF